MDTGIDIVSLIVAIAAALTAYAAWRKAKPEARASDAEAMAKYQEIIDRAAARELEHTQQKEAQEQAFLKKREELETKAEDQRQTFMGEIASLKKDIAELKLKLEAAIKQADSFEGWAKRLVAQLESLDVVPVPFVITRKGKKDEAT